MENQTIRIEINGIKYKAEIAKERRGYVWGIMRNKKCLVTGWTPNPSKGDLKVKLMGYMMRQLTYEVEHEIEKLIIK